MWGCGLGGTASKEDELGIKGDLGWDKKVSDQRFGWIDVIV